VPSPYISATDGVSLFVASPEGYPPEALGRAARTPSEGEGEIAVDASDEAGRLQEEIRALREESLRYREAAEQSLDQLDYCIDQFLGEKGTASMGRRLRENQRTIRRRLTRDET
jgi:hypothetical protein